MSYQKILNPRAKPSKGTPQSQPATENQVTNNAGGYVFQVDNWTRLNRFLLLGSSRPTYYVNAKDLTVANIDVVRNCLVADPFRTLQVIKDISATGRAYKNDAALLALAVAATSTEEKVRRLAFSVLPEVARIGTHLFQFNAFVDALGGKWGRMRRTGIANWYNEKTADNDAYQTIKYQSRSGWSHKDLIIKAHPKAASHFHSALFDWIVNDKRDSAFLPTLASVYDEMKAATDVKQVIALIRGHNLTLEFVPANWLGDAKVWEALLPNLPPTALLRNLGRLTANGLLAPLSNATNYVDQALCNADRMKKARVHPFSILIAQKIYAQGKGDKGSLTWTPVPSIVGALEVAFYDAFKYTEPTGKRILWGQDVSGSMSSEAGDLPLSCVEAGMAMAMTVARTEAQYHCMGFANDFRSLPINKTTTLDQALTMGHQMNFGRTDCAQPMIWAQQNKVDVDTFVVCTDNETWFGSVHPFQALDQYRQARGIPSRLIVIAMTPTEFSIANPDDGGMLDIAGIDANVPALISDFGRGNF